VAKARDLCKERRVRSGGAERDGNGQCRSPVENGVGGVAPVVARRR
jgi:hypothetical protein